MKERLTNLFSMLFKVYMAFVFVITLLFFYLPIRIFLTTEKQKQGIVFPIFVFWSRLLCFLCLYRVKHNSFEKLPSGPVVFVANHTSFLDIIFMYLLFPDKPFLFLGKAELLKVPLVKTFFKRLHIPVYREKGNKSGQAIKQAGDALRMGWSVIIFPEGGIKEELVPQLQPFKEGAFRLAAMQQVPIVPITFLSNYLLFADPSGKNSAARPGISYIQVHPTLPIPPFNDEAITEVKTQAFELIQGPLKKL